MRDCTKRPHQALAHLRSSFACECDRYNFLGLVDAREQPEIPLDQKSRFSRPGGCLNNKRLAGIKDTKALGQVRGIGVAVSWQLAYPAMAIRGSIFARLVHNPALHALVHPA